MSSRFILHKQFYGRDPKIVAKELLGKKLIRKINGLFFEGMIVETEAYYGQKDPASRAYHGLKNYNRQMWGESGTAFIYNVHKYWMFNIVSHPPDKVGAVLIRAIEPLKGVESLRERRLVKNALNLLNGPGKLTESLLINKDLNGISVHLNTSQIIIAYNEIDFKFEIRSSHRIGVKKDLQRNLRFFIKGNKFISKI